MARLLARTIIPNPARVKRAYNDRVKLDQHTVGNGVVAFLFATTGPMAILLAAAARGNLREAEIASWVAGAYGLTALLSIAFSVSSRQPLVFAWTIPGTVVVGAALDHLSFPEAVGAYVVTGALIAALGASGLATRVMAWVPVPLVMAMVAALFLPLGVGLVKAFGQHLAIAAAMVGAYVVASVVRAVGRYLPPVVAALGAGIAVLAADPGVALDRPIAGGLVSPILYTPRFTVRALVELVIPLTITVIGIQNAQGFAYLRTAGYRPPENPITVACGLGSIAAGLVGSVPACLTGPVTGILNLSGATAHRWVSAVVFAILAILFALFAPAVASLGLGLPPAFIAALGGLAMLGVLQTAFVHGFRGGFSLGATVTFIVTASQVTIFNVSAAFWGLVLGSLASALLERADYRALRERA
jgi:benzoate membrane transport protein